MHYLAVRPLPFIVTPSLVEEIVSPFSQEGWKLKSWREGGEWEEVNFVPDLLIFQSINNKET